MNGLLVAAPPRPRGVVFGLGWSTAAQVGSAAVKLASTLLLTRLLAPESYALLGTAMAVLTTLEWLSDFGVAAALVRHPNGADRGWLLVGWRLNLQRGVILAAATAAVAAPLAEFYQQPALTGVLLALAARPILIALRSPGTPLLRRNLEYRAVFADEMTQAVVGSAVAFAVASITPSMGAWALVAGTLSGAFVGVLLSYKLAPFVPRWHSDPDALRELRRFGGTVMVNTIAMAVWLNMDRLLGPRFLTLEAVGWYIVACNLAAAAEALLTRKLDVYFGLLSRRPPEERVDWHRRAANRVLGWAGPVLGLAAFLAPFVVRILYDNRYLPAGSLLSLMFVRLIVRLHGQLDFQLLLAVGTVRPATVSYILGGVAHAAGFVPLVLGFGPMGLVVSVLLSTIVVTASQCLLAPCLRGGMFTRLAISSVWVTLGLAAGYAAGVLAG